MSVERIDEIEADARAAVIGAATPVELEEARVRFLGRKAELTGILRGISDLDPAERGRVGSAANLARNSIEEMVADRLRDLEREQVAESLESERIDVTLPGSPSRPVGHLHPVTRTRRAIEDVLAGLGYAVLEGPEVEHDYYNFTALNHPEDHPARMLQDTFYVSPSEDLDPSCGTGSTDVLLRTHTSPMQVRAMEDSPPPLFVIVPGKTYRRDSDATHSPMFHQVEGLAVGEGLTLADLKGTLLALLRELFGPDREIRMRPHFFPFTEPSVEFDVSCFRCSGQGTLSDGSRCGICKGVGWIELGGAGMVDPNVFGFVAEAGYDPEVVTGFAFGFGVERIAMLRHGMGDLRFLFENDLRMLRQFS